MANFFTKTNKDMKYIFKKSANLNKKEKRRKKRGVMALIGLLLVLVELVISGLFLFEIFKLDIFPTKYFIMMIVILVLILLYNFTSQFTKAHYFGKFLSVLMSVILVFGYLVGSKVNWAFGNITNTKIETDVVDVIVLKHDSASSIKDALSYTFGYNGSIEETLSTKAAEQINSENNASISTKKYTSWDNLLEALYSNKDIKAIFMTEAMRASMSEEDTDFASKTKVLGNIKIITKTTVNTAAKKSKGEPFVVYISGNDGYGDISDVGRSDVNILAVINPETRQVLLISTPRDYYITISDANGRKGIDKLTHAGNAGTQGSIDALYDLYGFKADYFMKLNFDGCVKIVDALGGITIDSEVEFTNGNDAAPENYHFVKGLNECDGAMTLAFVRERQCFMNGDFQRGRNQQAAISGIINKATSPSILTSYSSVLEAATEVLYTNMPTSMITGLIKDQLADSTPWNVQSYAVSGRTQSNYCNLYGFYASTVVPDYDTVNIAIKLMNMIYNDKTVNVDEYVESLENETATGSAQ